MKVKTLVTIIVYVIVLVLYWFTINWLIDNPRPKVYSIHYTNIKMLVIATIVLCTLSWFVPLINYIEDHWNDNINLNKFK
jgi:hypothetical protein